MAHKTLPDAASRRSALAVHDRTLLVEAGAGSGKTALMAGRVALLLAAGIHPSRIVAITFTEAAAAELLERIEDIVGRLRRGEVPPELGGTVGSSLSEGQRQALEAGADAMDEITCTTIHGFCQQLIKPYPVEAGIDPGATIIDPAAADLAYADLMQAWLSARFGRDRSADGLGRIPPMPERAAENDFFAELLLRSPDDTLELVSKTAAFLRQHRTAKAPAASGADEVLRSLLDVVTACAAWYRGCGLTEPTTGDFVEDMLRIADVARGAVEGPLTGRKLAELLFHEKPKACKSKEIAFGAWRRKTRWSDAARLSGRGKAHGESLSAAGEAHYRRCELAYAAFSGAIGTIAVERFVAEFDAIRDLYRDYKRQAALLDFDDLLHHARDLLKEHDEVRQALAARYPHVLVDEFQDTDPLQTEILWLLGGEGDVGRPWQERTIRPGALFVVGDPKQAIYRFRGADVQTYVEAKRALEKQDPASALGVSANFRCRGPIIEFVNQRFAGLLSAEGQPGFSPLAATRAAGDGASVVAFEIELDDRHRNDRGKLVSDAVRREEAKVVADLVVDLIGSCPVWDKKSEVWRPAQAGDIALLAPTGTGLWMYERALEGRQISVATQAGKGFFRRQEVQDLIAVARAVADPRDTLALGALLRGPLVGLTEEEIADAVHALRSGDRGRLWLWTDPAHVDNGVLKRTLSVLQSLARKGRATTPYRLMAEAVDELDVRPLLKARHPRGSERALANVELVLEMARPYAARGMAEFARALRRSWDEGDAQIEGRPDAAADALSIVTMHSAKGLEWPIVIPVNSTTRLNEDETYVHRRSDDTVHFKMFGHGGAEYESAREIEAAEIRRERVRLWYVALTRARDLLLLPRQNERIEGDWFSLLEFDPEVLPAYVPARGKKAAAQFSAGGVNRQDAATWQAESETIAGAERRLTWRQPSRHEGLEPLPAEEPGEAFSSAEEILQPPPGATVRGGRERGVVLHKLLEEVLSGETGDDVEALRVRASELLAQIDVEDHEDAALGLSSRELAEATRRGLDLPDVAALRSRLLPELPVYAGTGDGRTMTLVAGTADAVAVDDSGAIDTVVDWKSDVAPTAAVIETYRGQVRDYMEATGATVGLIVFVTVGAVERVTLGAPIPDTPPA